MRLALLLLIACAPPALPTYHDCYEQCTQECDGDDCHGAGKRPVGVLLKNGSYVCLCGDFDA